MESEADYIGLMLMAEACYDPREAVQFWRRMETLARANHSLEIPEWMSTHPTVCRWAQTTEVGCNRSVTNAETAL